MKTIKSPVQANELFWGGTGCVLITTPTSIVLYDIQQGKKLGELAAAAVKYVIWSPDNQYVALLSKHGTFFLYSFN
jgi:coatomer subunit alpha